MERIESRKRRGEGFGCAGEHRSLHEYEVDGLQPVRDERAPGGGVLRRQRARQAQSVDGAQGLHGQKLARNEAIRSQQRRQVSRLAENETQQRGRIDVRDQRFERSRSKTERLSVGPAGGRGSRISLGLRDARRISSGTSASSGTIWATGVLRSRIVNVRPRRTLRRCSLRWALRSAMPTLLMTSLWSSQVTRQTATATPRGRRRPRPPPPRTSRSSASASPPARPSTAGPRRTRAFIGSRLARSGKPRMKKKTSGSSTDRNGPRTFIPISRWAGSERVRKISRNSARVPGFSRYVRISTITGPPACPPRSSSPPTSCRRRRRTPARSGTRPA